MVIGRVVMGLHHVGLGWLLVVGWRVVQKPSACNVAWVVINARGGRQMQPLMSGMGSQWTCIWR